MGAIVDAGSWIDSLPTRAGRDLVVCRGWIEGRECGHPGRWLSVGL